VAQGVGLKFKPQHCKKKKKNPKDNDMGREPSFPPFVLTEAAVATAA
jgi:hypothetical protein